MSKFHASCASAAMLVLAATGLTAANAAEDRMPAPMAMTEAQSVTGSELIRYIFSAKPTPVYDRSTGDRYSEGEIIVLGRHR